MSSNGVILQHRAELIAYLFVDRSDNLLIGNHIKKSLLDDRRLQLGKYPRPSGVRRKRLDRLRTRLLYLPLRFLYKFLILLSSLPLGFVQMIATLSTSLARYRSLVNSSRILQLIVTHPSSLRVRSTQVRDFLNSSCPTSPFNQVTVLTPLAGATQDSALSIHRPVSTVFLVRHLERPIIGPGRRRAWGNGIDAARW